MKFVSLIIFTVAGFFVSEVWATEIVAFHGLNQSIRSDAVYGPQDCTAALVNVEDHQFIENSIPSIDEAFNLGVTIGHINIRRTADDSLAVFHDEDLSCRTDGTGRLSQSSMAYLKQLDIGYGYSPAKGIFPTRGRGIGLMPTFEEVLRAFPGRPFAINVKSEDVQTAKLIEQTLLKFPSLNRNDIIYLGGANEIFRKQVSGIQFVATKEEHLKCLEAITKNSHVRHNCEGLLLALPFEYARPILNRLPHIISSLHTVNARIWVWDVNTPEDAGLLKGISLDAVGTYRIDKTSSVLKEQISIAPNR